MTVTECSLTSCMLAHILIGSHTMLGQRIVSPLQLHWVKGVCMFRCNQPPALLAECPGSFMCNCSNMGAEQTPNKVSTQIWLWKRKFSCHSCLDSNLQPFDHESSTLTNKLSQLPYYYSGNSDERPPLIKDCLYERPPWWETTLMRDHPNEKPPQWETTLIRDHSDKRHPDERPP